MQRVIMLSADHSKLLTEEKSKMISKVKGLLEFGIQVGEHQHLHIIDDEAEILYKGTCAAICLGEIAAGHPEDALVKNVQNCTACREIIATTDKSLGLPLINQKFVELYAQRQGKIGDVNVAYSNGRAVVTFKEQYL